MWEINDFPPQILEFTSEGWNVLEGKALSRGKFAAGAAYVSPVYCA